MRTWMFVPGNKRRFLEKAAESDADAVFLDLEDGVLPESKAEAREMVAEALATSPFNPLRYVRINAVETPWYQDDLETVLVPGLDGLCVPKVESPAQVEQVADALASFEQRAGLDVGSTRIVAAIESAHSLTQAAMIAKCHPRIVAIMLGTEDFALDLGLGADRVGEARELIYARSAIVVAAAAARVLSIDGVFPNLDDPEGFFGDVTQARRLGFAAKSTFNPRQVADINRIFSPTSDEIAYAEKVVAGFEEARRRGDASVAVGGQLVDLPIVMRAQRLLQVAQAAGATS